MLMKIKPKHVLWISILILACENPFASRKSEPPVVQHSSWVPPHYPDQVMTNLQNAVVERNVENYIRCFVHPEYSEKVFRFDADPKEAADHPGAFDLWSLDQEQSVIQEAFSLVPIDSLIVLRFTEIVREILTPDSAVVVRRYQLELHHGQSSLPRMYEGQAEFWLTEDQKGEWSIYRWIDNGIVGYPSWSFLKISLGG
jgi:hypothetical protein